HVTEIFRLKPYHSREHRPELLKGTQWRFRKLSRSYVNSPTASIQRPAQYYRPTTSISILRQYGPCTGPWALSNFRQSANARRSSCRKTRARPGLTRKTRRSATRYAAGSLLRRSPRCTTAPMDRLWRG